jgi:hypothetical protein
MKNLRDQMTTAEFDIRVSLATEAFEDEGGMVTIRSGGGYDDADPRFYIDTAVAAALKGTTATRPAWADASTLEISALVSGLAASDRDGSIDHTGKALHAELEEELERRLRESA